MKRSEINQILKNALVFMAEKQFFYPLGHIGARRTWLVADYKRYI